MQAAFYLLATGVALLTAIAVAWDLRVRKIPNWLTVSGLAAALVFHVATGGWSGLGTAAGGFAVGFGLLLVLWLIGGGGGGDVKLMAALGAWMGPLHIVYVFVLSTVLVLMIAAVRIARQTMRRGVSLSAIKKSMQKGSAAALQQTSGAGLIPYALPVAVASYLVLVWKYFLLQV